MANNLELKRYVHRAQMMLMFKQCIKNPIEKTLDLSLHKVFSLRLYLHVHNIFSL